MCLFHAPRYLRRVTSARHRFAYRLQNSGMNCTSVCSPVSSSCRFPRRAISRSFALKSSASFGVSNVSWSRSPLAFVNLTLKR